MFITERMTKKARRTLYELASAYSHSVSHKAGPVQWAFELDAPLLFLRAFAAILRSKLESNFAALNARLNVTRQDEAKREYQLLQLVLAWMEAEAEASSPFRLR